MIYIAEIDYPTKTENWLSDRAGIYKTRIYADPFIVTIGDVDCFYDNIPQIDTTVIRSIKNGIVEMSQLMSNSELDNSTCGNCFYYDKEQRTIYCNFGNSSNVAYQSPYNLEVSIGLIVGFSNCVDYTRTAGAYYDDVVYQPRIKKLGNITKKIDNLSYGVLSRAEMSLSFINTDGFFDDVNYAGATYRLFALNNGDEIESGTLVDTGIVSKSAVTHTEYQMTIISKRDALNNAIDCGNVISPPYPPVADETVDGNFVHTETIISTDTTSGITTAITTTKYNGIIQPDLTITSTITPIQIPLCYNQIVKAQPIPVANDLTTIKYIFCAVKENDAYNNILRQPSNIKDIWYETTNDNGLVVKTSVLSSCVIDYETGSFTIPTSVNDTDIFTSDNSTGSYTTLFISFTGWSRSILDEVMGNNLTGLEITTDLLDVFSRYYKTPVNYDIESITNTIAAQKRQNRNVSIMITDNTTKVLDIITKLCVSTDTVFMELSDGRFSARIDNENTDSILTIIPQQFLSHPTYSTDISNIITSLSVEYGYEGDSSNKKTYIDASTQKTIQAKYHVVNATSIDSVLADIHSARDKTEHVLKKALNPITSTSFKIPLNKSNAGLSLISSITAPRDRKHNLSLWQITSIDKDLQNNILTIGCNKLQDSDLPANYVQGYLDNAEYSNSKYFSTTKIDD